MRLGKQTSPAAELERFLNYIDACRQEYTYAYGMVGEEDRKLQDLLHAVELAKDYKERNQAAAKLQQSRRSRRKNKDIVLMDERIVNFFNEPKNRDTLNRMRQLLGQQRKEEEYLTNERTYIPRAGR